MRKIFTILLTCLAMIAYAATEPAWYNDVTSITANGQYYIYSVNGKAFMQAGKAQVQAITTSNYNNASAFKFTISKADQGTVKSGNYYLKVYREISGTSSGPLNTKTENGTSIIWTLMDNGDYWNIHSYYNVFGDRYPALYYKDNKYDAYLKHNGGIDYSNTKDLQTGTEYRWYLVSQAQLDRHFAIYFFDAYKESCNLAQYENQVPASYYAALQTAYNKSFSVQNTAHTAEVVNAAKADLQALYSGAEAVKAAYNTAKGAINALEAVEDKGEDFAQITTDIANARTAIEQAMSVEEVNASVAGLKAVDPITFHVTAFMAGQALGTPATTAAGRAISYEAANKNIINAAGMPIYKGATILTATAEATDAYYKFVRTAQVTVDAEATYSDFERTTCDEAVEFFEQTYEESFAGNLMVGVNYMGGDSIVRVAITINHATFGTDSKTIVYGAEESWNGIDLSQYAVGTHNVPFVTTNAVGCDSTVTLTLTVNKQETLNVPVELSFCQGGSEEYRGVEYTEAGTFNVPAEGATRDTLYVVKVTVLEPTFGTDTKTIVYGADEEWNGIALKDSTVGVHYVVFDTTNVAGCDSTVTLALTVNKQETLNVPVELAFCQGGSEEYRGVEYTEAGTFSVPAEGETRDTLYVVNVTVHEVYSFNETGTAKVGEGYVWQDSTYETPATGSYQYEAAYTTVNGCDSIYHLTLTVTKADVVEIPVELEFCAGGSEFYRGTEYTAAGLYPVYAEGEVADTIYNVTVTVNVPTYDAVEMTIQFGDEEEWNGIDLSEYTVGTHEIPFETTNVAGCDSTITLTLTVEKMDMYEAEQELEFCAGDTVEYLGVKYTEAGEYPVYIEGEVQDTTINVIVTVHDVPVILPGVEEVVAGQAVTLPEGEWYLGDSIVSDTIETEPVSDTISYELVQYAKTEFGCEYIEKYVVVVTPNYEAIDHVQAGAKAEKFFRNGVLYIRRGEKIYTTTGDPVK